jgi:hypothetical protein
MHMKFIAIAPLMVVGTAGATSTARFANALLGPRLTPRTVHRRIRAWPE